MLPQGFAQDLQHHALDAVFEAATMIVAPAHNRREGVGFAATEARLVLMLAPLLYSAAAQPTVDRA